MRTIDCRSGRQHQTRGDRLAARSYQIAGVILAGGRSRRMFGNQSGDKALLDLAGRPLIAHVIDRLAPQVGGLAINANREPSHFAAFHLPVISDADEAFPGPLGGVAAGLAWAGGHQPRPTHVVTVPSDTPFLPDDLVERLFRAIAGQPTRIAIAASAVGLHPVIGLWPLSCASDVAAALAAGRLKMHAFVAELGAISVNFSDVRIGGRDVDPFFNANTPEDLDAARRLLQT